MFMDSRFRGNDNYLTFYGFINFCIDKQDFVLNNGTYFPYSQIYGKYILTRILTGSFWVLRKVAKGLSVNNQIAISKKRSNHEI